MATATKRTDIHRPSAIDPEAYEFVGVEYDKVDDDIGKVFMLAEERNIIRRHKERTGGKMSKHQHGGNCHICGAHCIYTALFYHPETNVYIRTGFDCADKMHMGDESKFRAFKKSIHDARERQAGKNKAEAILADAGLSRAWELYIMSDRGDRDAIAAIGEGRMREPNRYESEMGVDYEVWDTTTEFDSVIDIVGRLVRYGNISEGQEKFLHVLIRKIDNRKQIEAERAAEKAKAEDCPTGRVKIAGTVIKTEARDSQYGLQFKMTVKDDRGFLVWGTIPSNLQLIDETKTEGSDTWIEQRSLNRNDRVEFTATVTPSDRDAKFGFFKRPSKAKLISEQS